MSESTDFNPYQAPASSAYSGNEPGYFGSPGDAEVSARTVAMLVQTQPWVRFISVLIFIAFGLMLLGVVVAFFIGAGSGRAELMGVAAAYAAVGAIYLIPAVFLGRYASQIASLRLSHRVADLENALEAQKSFWKFIGIVAIIVLVIYVIAILVVVLSGAYWFASGTSTSRF